MNNTTNRVSNAPADPQRVITGNARLSYAYLCKPKKSKEGTTEKYSCTVLIPKTDTATMPRINNAIEAAAQWATTNKWSNARPPVLPTPVYDGDGVRPNGTAFGPECKGHWVLTASSDAKPEVVDLNLNPIIDQTQIYSGMYGLVSIRFYGYLNNGKKGIGAALGNVQKTADGEPLSVTNVSANQDFGVGAAPWQQPAQQQYQAPAYTPPAVQQQYQAPAYTPPAVQQQYQTPAYTPPAAQQQPGYGAPAQQQYQALGQPLYQQPAIDPITGMPIGGIKGI